MIRSFLRRVLPALAILVCGGLMAATGYTPDAAAQGAGLDRAAIAAGFCGKASEAGEALVIATDALTAAPAEDLAWLKTLTTALMGRDLRCVDGRVLVKAEDGLRDAVTGEAVEGGKRGRTPILNLRNRGDAENLDAALSLLSEASPAARAQAISILARRPEKVPTAVYARAAEASKDPAEKAEISDLAVVASLSAEDPADRIAGINALADQPNRRNLARIEALAGDPLYETNSDFAGAVDAARSSMQRWVQVSAVLSTFYNGLSYASILFIAAVGLAIIFGLMGVINLAQGEFIMLGAYTTFVVQETIQRIAPSLIDWYLIIALPFAFLVTAAIGVALEFTIVRHLYRRPLMTLLATWAVSLFLVNLVRVTFGTQNLQFATPGYISGGFTLVGDFIVTYNRLFAIVFATLVLALTWFILKRTSLGLNIRTVTQNREIAGCIGIHTRKVDMMAFGFGSGLAGLAGLALAPIYNVNPLMGTNFIIESFMVVVLGGVGTIAGTVFAALGIGQINVLIEPLYGAVAAKVIVLVLIIAFIQWRPEGLFAAPGRRK